MPSEVRPGTNIGATGFELKALDRMCRQLASGISSQTFPTPLDELRSPDLGAIAEFHELLGGDHFRVFLAEVTNAFETSCDPGALWARWIEVVVERTPAPPPVL